MKIKIKENVYWNPFVLIKNIMALVCIIILLWTVVSYGEVLILNTDIHVTEYPDLSVWNFWKILGSL